MDIWWIFYFNKNKIFSILMKIISKIMPLIIMLLHVEWLYLIFQVVDWSYWINDYKILKILTDKY